MNLRLSPIALAVAAALPAIISASAFAAEEPATLDAVVVTAPTISSPTTVQMNPKNAIQPLPVNDGASFLKAIPGMNMTRKAGTDGDPSFRGMAGSRLNILIDGEQIYGGCPGRMDPPTAYVFPETYDKVTLIKGPQSVLYGSGGSAGTVMFERKPSYFTQPGIKGNASITAGSFGRVDTVLDATAGSSLGYVRMTGTDARSEDYKDGDGKKVHSKYERSSMGAAVGWTPDANTVLELSAISSKAKAAYADRTMDGAKFDRENLSLKFEKRNISPLVEKIEASAYYNHIDHVMDNYSLRKKTAMMYMVSNPDRETVGSRAVVTLRPSDMTQVKLGTEFQTNTHTGRMVSNASFTTVSAYETLPRSEDANFKTASLFAEATRYLNNKNRVVGGYRFDDWTAKDPRAQSTAATQSNMGSATGGTSRTEKLNSGFMRFEHDYALASTAYVGLGHTERAPDYWESSKAYTATSNSAFQSVKPEKTTQLDAGTTWKSGAADAFVSTFYNKVKDFILLSNRTITVMGASSIVSVADNIDATTWGAETGINYQHTPTIRTGASLAYVRGINDTYGGPLAQISPLEARLTANYDNKVWSAGALVRAVAKQTQVAPNQGNIVGKDIGETGGFATLSLHGAYRVKKDISIAAGIDNVFNRTYAEHISRGGSMVSGYTQTLRVNEPGQVIWVRGQIAF